MAPKPNIFVFSVGMEYSRNRIGHKARQDLKFSKDSQKAWFILSIALHGKEVAFKRIGIFSMLFKKKDKRI